MIAALLSFEPLKRVIFIRAPPPFPKPKLKATQSISNVVIWQKNYIPSPSIYNIYIHDVNTYIILNT